MYEEDSTSDEEIRNDSITSAQVRDVEHIVSPSGNNNSNEAIILAGASRVDVGMIAQNGNTVQRQAQQNRLAVQGVSKFSQSVNFLSEKLAKGPTSESGIKKLELGLTTQMPPRQNKSEPQQQQQQQQSQPSVSSPMRDSIFKVGESLVEISRILEQIEAQSTRIVVAKKRKEMLQKQRERLLHIAAKKNVPLGQPPHSHGGKQHNIGVVQATAMMMHQ